MKIHGGLLFIVLCLLYSYTIAQPYYYNQDIYVLKRLHYTNSSGEKGVTTFIYDINNNLYKAVWELLDSSRYSINYYTLDKRNVIAVDRTFSDGISSKKTYNYNEEGLLVEETFERSDSVYGEAKYYYKNNNVLEKIIANKMNGWFTGELHFIYNNDIRESAKIFMKNNQVGTVKYSYSEDGNLLEEFWDFQSKWTQTFTYEYIKQHHIKWVNSNPLLKFCDSYVVEKEEYSYNNETGGPSFYVYDKAGKLIEKTFKRSDGLRTVTKFEYDKKGKLIKSYRNYTDNSTGIFTYHYNQNGQIVEKNFKKTDDIKSYESFSYDTHGNLRFVRYDNMDGWLTGNIFFELDRYDRIKTGAFTSDQGYNAIIAFYYNKQDLVTSIKWTFSSGKTQTYSFKYKPINP